MPLASPAPDGRPGRVPARPGWPAAFAGLLLLMLAIPFPWVAGALGVPAAQARPAAAALPGPGTPAAFLPLFRRDQALAATATPTTVPAGQPTPTPSGVRASDFGLVWVNSAESPSDAARINRGAATGARLDRFPIYWQYIEKSPGQYDWHAQDQALAANQGRGLGTLGILFGVPGFYYSAQAAGSSASQPLPRIGGSFVEAMAQPDRLFQMGGCTGGTPPPQGLSEPIFTDSTDTPGPGKAVNGRNYWARFVDQAARRYGPSSPVGIHVNQWEIWNEPDLCKYWSGTPVQFARLLQVAYLVIKQANPQATVVWGGLATFEQPDFVVGLVNELHRLDPASRYGGYFDAAAGHHYSILTNGSDWTAHIRSALAGAGWGGKPIWITESGVPICGSYPGPDCPSPWRATAQEQAAYMWENIFFTRMAGGGPIFQFMLHDDCGNSSPGQSPADGFGLVLNGPGDASKMCSPDGNTPRLAYSSFTLAARYFSGTELRWWDTQQTATGPAQRAGFYDPVTHERRLLLFALDTAAVTARVPATGPQARLVSLDGSERLLTPVNGGYDIPLSGATNHNSLPPDPRIGIYGVPQLLIERDTVPPISAIQGLAAASPPSFGVTWSAADAGAGVAAVALYYQRDDEAWQLWLSGQAANGSATFNGLPEHRYRFAALASDRAGNAVTQPVAQAETWTGQPLQPADVVVSGRVTNVRGQPAAGVGVHVGSAGETTDGQGSFTVRVTPGRYDVAVNGRTLIHWLAVNGDTTLALLAPPAANAVTNGDFESGLAGWQQAGTAPLAVEAQGDSLDHALRLATGFAASPGVPGDGGPDTGGNSTLSQRIHVPTGQPYLALRYRIDTQEPPPGRDAFEVLLFSGNERHELLVRRTAAGWAYFTGSLAAYAGTDVSLVFNLYQSSANLPTSAWLDWVSVGE